MFLQYLTRHLHHLHFEKSCSLEKYKHIYAYPSSAALEFTSGFLWGSNVVQSLDFCVVFCEIEGLWSYGSWIYNFLCNQCLSPLTCELESRSGEVYSVQHYVIKFVSDLWQVGGFLRFPPPIKLIAMIYLKYCWQWRWTSEAEGQPINGQKKQTMFYKILHRNLKTEQHSKLYRVHLAWAGFQLAR
jgi:hypothetical protein